MKKMCFSGRPLVERALNRRKASNVGFTVNGVKKVAKILVDSKKWKIHFKLFA